ncbi:uncharacterized protein B0I36DRAFT_48587 [Microdochium trichocladiopsis]|uniref:DUF6594 domain-containing protein n=1 Tax=Microdochium trichocladiopsis TaxID=1682393 RepID=A0A9P9BJ21_9PEZI|nr:uncharacterized protein B0I36DRAFT_48587 [Microdochium trichocladiopsis]KAH7014191.1 hypothetical protein B0I36DRAFT_48587 [Microdochium trichocladiopsis]
MSATWARVRNWFLFHPQSEVDIELGKAQSFPDGYPQYTALLATHSPWMIFRRFDKVGARILLLKQDKISVLEEKLEDIDQNERSLLFLGKSRSDRNEDRKVILQQLETAINNYDEFAQSFSRALNLQAANARDVTSLHNWIEGTGCLYEAETAYLSHQDELVALAPQADNTLLKLETSIEDFLIRWRRPAGNPYGIDLRPNQVYMHAGQHIHHLGRMALVLAVALLMMGPVVVCNLVNAQATRIAIIGFSIATYLAMISSFTKARTLELTVAAAT